ncbi:MULTISPECIES: hybrid sensor histidine kinase/response regulator [Stenotrophomonas]|uniref:hybrid sensor histidine kinase/response regulator n=1 Tax=Stenotrophomonas TaxID=40323 RepID=UPI00066B8611|nr:MULTISPECIES: hybrid sensor histidine kinase/response regulator [Stenotrophomonas]MDH2178278.1 PAS domain-containing protein [Stenotrophomonas sp. GD03654]
MRDGSRRSERLRILMLEDSALDAELISAQLQRAGLDFEAERLWTRNAFIEAIDSRPFDVILADHVLPGFDGDAALALARERVPQTPFIFVSGTLTEELAVQALTRGARDYVVKQRLQRLPDAIRRARQEAHERTQLVRAQVALNDSQAQLQQVTDAVPALIAQLDNAHRYRFANKAFLDWHGFSLAELLGRTARDVSGISAFERALPSLERVLQGERTSFQVELVHRSGQSRFVQMDCVPEHAADGSVAGYICLGSDVSQLKQAELALREDNQLLEQQVQARTAELRASKRRLQAIFESSFQHQMLLDLSGRVMDANDASLAAVLADKKDVVGQRFGESLWFATTDGIGALIDRAVAAAVQGRSSLHSLELELPTGPRSFDFSFRPLLDAEGVVTAVVSEAVETTARLQAEHALRQSQKIEAVGQLTGGIAHDFNNILTVISGNVEHAMLLNERAGEAGAMVSRALDNALKGVGRAASLTQRLLAFARRQPLHSQAANLHERLLDMHDMLQRALGELVQLEIRSAEDIWCVEIDISQLEASVLNLAVNARDAMPHGGRLVIEVDNSHLDHDYAALFPDATPGEYVMLRVRDNGHGMDAATLARVFEPFFTTKQVGRGTGLGLSMVHGFVKQSGGHVLIDSVEGGGTSITMMFPRSPLALPCEARTPQTGLAGYSPREETILVAEDNDDVRAHTVDSLRLLGYRVLEAHDGPSALRLLERPDTRVNLLFSDVVMPGMSGWELVREVRERWPEVAVLFTSGYPRDHDQAGSQGRAVALLPKPFTRSDLATAVRTALEAAPH